MSDKFDDLLSLEESIDCLRGLNEREASEYLDEDHDDLDCYYRIGATRTVLAELSRLTAENAKLAGMEEALKQIANRQCSRCSSIGIARAALAAAKGTE